MEDKLEIDDSFYFDIFRGDICINMEECNRYDKYMRSAIITKEKAKEIIELLTKFVEEK